MSTALYRRYRPETFADVIGQEHVTEPLMQALRTGRVNHAYLFSGPRGCGKTTSARILARCLNCEQGPTPTPCGTCDSCVALARGGSGSVDVIEIDAASHGGVDDARDLRERASYGPAQSRYKIYIIDEAHMVTPQGFNALLKIVEEPPEHVKFVFATTEPEKVIGTIRSRTHHYPFRLVPPGQLTDYMARLCERERVAVAPGVLSFVTRAGGGSVRDSLSVLDQLIAGSSDDGLTYESAAALLGFTDGELLDAIIDAFAAGDAAGVFHQVDRVIETGLDPRRFVEDLLERLRDLIVVAAVPDGASSVLRGLPEDQLERMRQQSAAFGSGSLSRAADIVNAGLTEMTGATAPRLQLELICARVLLPAASGESGYAARLDRLERRLDVEGVPSVTRVRAVGAAVPRRPLRSPQAARRCPRARLPPSPLPRLRDPAAARPRRRPSGPSPHPSGRRADRPSPIARPEPPSPPSRAAGRPVARERAPRHQAPSGRASAARPGPRPRVRGPAPATAEPGCRSARHRASAGAPLRRARRGRGAAGVAGHPRLDLQAQAHHLDPAVRARDASTTTTAARWCWASPPSASPTPSGTGPHADLVRQALIDVLGVDARVEGIPVPDAALARPSGEPHPSVRPDDLAPGSGEGPAAGSASASPAPAGHGRRPGAGRRRRRLGPSSRRRPWPTRAISPSVAAPESGSGGLGQLAGRPG